MSDESKSTVFIVDDDSGVRSFLSLLIKATGLNVEAYASAGEFLDAYDPSCPGCLVLDVVMPGMDGLELQDELAYRDIYIPTIMITGHGDVTRAVRAMKAGALDFIEKPFSDQLLLKRVKTALDLDARHRAKQVLRDSVLARVSRLTPREKEVLDLVVDGKTTKQIAAMFGVSGQAVDAHRARLMRKMQVSNVVELVRLSLEAKAD